MTPSRETLIAEAIEICTICRTDGVEVRAFGGVAAAIVGEGWFRKYPERKRSLKDIDLIGRRKDLNRFRRTMQERDYRETRRIAIETEGDRALFGKDAVAVDFVSDALRFAQTLPVKDRLAKSFPTLSVSDLLLEKLQIADPQLPQLIDFFAILFSPKRSSIEADYIGRILGSNWGYWHSTNLFLEKARSVAKTEHFTDEIPLLVEFKGLVDSVPKTLAWKFRSWFGEHLPWHEVVESITSA
jgi:hypothetical protein